jgi:eukaryotic-like serine/threonine-protein kinase
MSIDTGTRLGHYEIRTKIGAGGMGEVYLAEDTKLERKVALKILPADVAQNAERMQRFIREAKAASSLNHPNIAHIYEIGEGDGVNFIAMEYVEGESLSEEIAGCPLPVSQIIAISTQIADALEDAHENGIVHRDIKSQNVMLTKRGRVKVLDFGLAKISSKIEEGGNEDSTRVKTAPGVVMGTVSYMSPEQALGREADARTDVWSLGIILYEMATGRLPFQGESVTETIDKIAHSQPEAIARFNYEIPAELEIIIKKALRKNREERYQSAQDILIDLRALGRELDQIEHSIAPDLRSGGVSTKIDSDEQATKTLIQNQTTGENTATQTASSAEYIVSGIKSHKKMFGAAILGLLLVIGGIVFALYKFGGKTEKAPPQALKIERLTTNGKSAGAAVSPDGKYVIYTVYEGGGHSLWLRQVIAASNVQIIPAKEDVYYLGLNFTPDSNFINFVKAQFEKNVRSELIQMPVLGGAQKKLLLDVGGGITYSPDGKQIAFIRSGYPNAGESALMIANADGTGERILAQQKAPLRFHSREVAPAWSPDGKTIACIINDQTAGIGQMYVVEVNVADGISKAVVTKEWEEIKRIAWFPDKSGLLVLGVEKGTVNYIGQIWRFSYPQGEARRITADFNDYWSMSLPSDAGTLVTVQSNVISNIWVVPNGDAGRAVQIKSGGNNLEGREGIAWTPDGRIVYDSLASGALDIWIMNADGTNQKQLTVDAGINFRAKVTPDNRYIVFASIRNDQANVWRMNLDGSNPKQLTGGNSDWFPAVTPDSRWVIYTAQKSGMPYLWKVSIDGGDAVHLIDTYANFAEISPDGKWIICSYRKDDKSTWRYAIIPSEGGEPLKVFDLVGKHGDFRWAPDGRSLHYLRDSPGGVTNIWSLPLDDKPPKQLTDFKTDQIYNFALSPDGKSLALARGATTADVILIKDFR